MMLMKRRPKFELLITDIRKALADPTGKDRVMQLQYSTWNLRQFDETIAADIGKARLLVDVAVAARDSTGPGRAVAEEQILCCMEAVVDIACRQLEDMSIGRIPDHHALDGLPGSVRLSAQIAGLLCDYAMDCLQHEVAARDPTAGLRRALAFQILAMANGCFKLPDVLDFARQALRRNRSQEVCGAIAFLEGYFKARNELPVPEDIVQGLLAVAEQTDIRSTAVGALNALVETGIISEMEALDRLDDWKQERY
jgi:hypothetical protein